jgi:anti-anti-sigma factor
MESSKRKGDVRVISFSQKEVTLSGWLNAGVRLSINTELCDELVVSLRNVRYLGSQVLSSLVEMRGRCRDLGIRFSVLVNTRELAELMRLVGFDKIMQIEYSAVAA